MHSWNCAPFLVRVTFSHDPTDFLQAGDFRGAGRTAQPLALGLSQRSKITLHDLPALPSRRTWESWLTCSELGESGKGLLRDQEGAPLCMPSPSALPSLQPSQKLPAASWDTYRPREGKTGLGTWGAWPRAQLCDTWILGGWPRGHSLGPARTDGDREEQLRLHHCLAGDLGIKLASRKMPGPSLWWLHLPLRHCSLRLLHRAYPGLTFGGWGLGSCSSGPRYWSWITCLVSQMVERR